MKYLADDSQLWKAAYYFRFVRPRASRIPGLRGHDTSAKALHYSSKLSKWLEDDHLVRGGKATNWKRQYKLRHNWSRGSCNVSQAKIAEHGSIPPLLARLHEDVVFTADATEGLRAWSMVGEPKSTAAISFSSDTENNTSSPTPTSLAVDASISEVNAIGIAVGFLDGRFAVYNFDRRQSALVLTYRHAPSSNGIISAIAYASPYVLTMTEAQLLSLYVFPNDFSHLTLAHNLSGSAPRLLSSLKSHTAWPPLSLSIRASSTNIFASIAYAMPTYLTGWSVGLQELLLTVEGGIIESRLASAEPQGFQSLLIDNEEAPTRTPNSRGLQSTAYPSKPTSLCYTHPYLLAAHADNTLTLYMVVSNAENLIIGPGRRLWGHTSSVASAHVGDRGKAVSVSKRGNELRVWELEGGIVARASKKSMKFNHDGTEGSIQLRPAPKASNLLEIPQQDTRAQFRFHSEDTTVTKEWVAFDEEKVVVLREERLGPQALVVYDFT